MCKIHTFVKSNDYDDMSMSGCVYVCACVRTSVWVNFLEPQSQRSCTDWEYNRVMNWIVCPSVHTIQLNAMCVVCCACAIMLALHARAYWFIFSIFYSLERCTHAHVGIYFVAAADSYVVDLYNYQFESEMKWNKMNKAFEIRFRLSSSNLLVSSSTVYAMRKCKSIRFEIVFLLCVFFFRIYCDFA